MTLGERSSYSIGILIVTTSAPRKSDSHPPNRRPITQELLVITTLKESNGVVNPHLGIPFDRCSNRLLAVRLRSTVIP